MSAEIILEDVSKTYPGGVDALTNVSLRIEPGEFVVLVGPSGCGKSTLLRLVAGLDEPTAGEVWIGGRVVNGVSPKDRDVAMVFQSYALYPHMTVAENMGFGLRLRRRPRVEISERVREAASILGLEDLLERRPATLSGGQRQRVAMGRAIVRRPAAFLMDEPLSNLDAQLRVSMRGELRQLHQRLGVTTLYVTHDQVEAMTLGDGVAVLSQGVLQQKGAPNEIFERPANLFVATFIGSPPMNLLRARAEGGKIRLGGTEIAVRHPAVPPEVIVGIRPAALEDAEFVAGERRVTIEVVTELVEHLGEEKHLLFQWPADGAVVMPLADQALGTLLTARVDARSRALAGSPVRLCFCPEDLYLFDPQSGDAL